MFLTGACDFKRLEVSVKRYTESRDERSCLERECTKTQLKEIYHWDQC